LPGAAMAVLTPDWARSPILNAFVWHSFVMHLLLSTYVIMRLVAREMTPSARDLWRSVVFLAVVVPPTALVNHALGTNFFFLSVPVPGSPLAPVHQMFGGFYLVGLALLLVVFWTPMYLPWGIVRLRQGLTVRARAVTVS
ncbi:MAG: YwaF family protein, partial [Actinomycetia bacterium]|nr:YwaF family protein [Actinomycetes bacterium]